MKVLMIGGTGLLGSQSAAELIKRGHHVKTVSLPPLPSADVLPKEMEVILDNIVTMSDEQLSEHFKGCDAFVFAAGVDERVEFPAPVLEYYQKYNIKPLQRLLTIARNTGVKRVVVMGSYFAHFAKKWTNLKLTEKHPYIKSRILQEEAALSFNSDDMQVMVLELPYIFGTQPGRKPVWTFLVESIASMKGATFFTKGGTSMVTVKQVAQAVAGALEYGRGGVCYPVGWYNMTWKEMLTIFHKYMDIPTRIVLTIPTFLYRMNGRKLMKDSVKRGIDPGLNMIDFSEIQTSKTFIDKSIIRDELGVTEDNIDQAIGDSVKLCLDVINQKVEVIEMKAQ